VFWNIELDVHKTKYGLRIRNCAICRRIAQSYKWSGATRKDPVGSITERCISCFADIWFTKEPKPDKEDDFQPTQVESD
jgi:hypothetical protein